MTGRELYNTIKAKKTINISTFVSNFIFIAKENLPVTDTKLKWSQLYQENPLQILI